MKKYGLLVSGIIVFIIGVALIVSGFGVIGFNLDKLQVGGYEMRTVEEINSDITSLNIDSELGYVKVAHGETFSVKLNESKYYTYDVTSDNGVLKVVGKYKSFLYRMFWIGTKNVGMEITIPKDGLNLDIHMVNSVIELNGLNFGNMKVTSTNGKISLYEIAAGACEVSTVNDEITVRGSSFESFKGSTTNGKVTLANTTSKTTLEGRSTNGEMFVTSTESKTLKMSVINGKISISQVKAEEIDLVTTNGSITGDVKGVLSEYTVDTRSTNGQVTPGVQEGTTDKKFRARTTNGNISVTFTNEN